MSTTPNSDPGIMVPEVQFSQPQIQYLGNFTNNLREAYHLSSPDDQSGYFQSSVDRIVESNVSGALQLREVGAESLQLVVTAEAIGATTDQQKIHDLFDVLNRNPLLDHDDGNILLDLTANVSRHRMNGATDEEVAGAVSMQVGNIMDVASRIESQGKSQKALKIAVRAFSAGATIRVPQYQAAEQLMQVATSLTPSS